MATISMHDDADDDDAGTILLAMFARKVKLYNIGDKQLKAPDAES